MRAAPVRPTAPAAWGRSRSVRRLEEDEQVGRGGELRGEPRGCARGRGGSSTSGGDAEGPGRRA